MTKAVYTATAEYILEMAQRPVKHRVSVSGVLKHLGISRSGYNAWKKRCPSATEKHREEVKEKILKIYEDSHQNYGAPKITRELWKDGEKIAVKAVTNYMQQMGIKAQWVKPYAQTIIDSDFSKELHNILQEQFNPEQPDTVWVSDITYIWTFEGFVYLTSIYGSVFPKNDCMGTQRNSGSIPCSGLRRESKENTQHYTAADYTYKQRLPVCIRRISSGNRWDDKQLFKESISMG